MQGLSQIIKQNQQAVDQFKSSKNRQLRNVAKLAKNSNQAIVGKQQH